MRDNPAVKERIRRPEHKDRNQQRPKAAKPRGKRDALEADERNRIDGKRKQRRQIILAERRQRNKKGRDNAKSRNRWHKVANASAALYLVKRINCRIANRSGHLKGRKGVTPPPASF